MARASEGGERASARRAHIAGTRRKLRPKKAKEPLITLTKSSLVTPIAPPRRARAASSEGGVGLRSAGVGAAILDAESCVAVAEATSRARASFIIEMEVSRSITSGVATSLHFLHHHVPRGFWS